MNEKGAYHDPSTFSTIFPENLLKSRPLPTYPGHKKRAACAALRGGRNKRAQRPRRDDEKDVEREGEDEREGDDELDPQERAAAFEPKSERGAVTVRVGAV